MPGLQSSMPNILVAPLDWGLGHATRCIPIIYALIESGAKVVLAGNDIQKALLLGEFPQYKFINLKGYNVKYARRKSKLLWQLAKQLPGIKAAVQYENDWLKDIITKEKIDGVISDNRYGLYHESVPCVFITHQLMIKNPLGIVGNKVVQFFNYKRIKKFDRCWIPDYAGIPGLSGDLAHPVKMPDIAYEYIGSLSRMRPDVFEKKTNHILIMISGPEPQRSIFEQIIFRQLPFYKGTATVVRGLPADKEISTGLPNVIVHNHLSKDLLNVEMCKAEYIICRSGYSSVMDINTVCAKSILVPTPGQTEQEYLGKYLMQNSFAMSCCQSHFNLQQVLEKAKSFSYSGFINEQPQLLKNAVAGFLADCMGCAAH